MVLSYELAVVSIGITVICILKRPLGTIENIGFIIGITLRNC